MLSRSLSLSKFLFQNKNATDVSGTEEAQQKTDAREISTGLKKNIQTKVTGLVNNFLKMVSNVMFYSAKCHAILNLCV